MNLRIIKQYEEAIRACRMGKAIDTSGLPCPPGFPSLPNTSKDNSLIQTSGSISSFLLLISFMVDEFFICGSLFL